MSEITKKYKVKYMITKALEIALTFGPLIAYVIIGFAGAEPTRRVLLSLSTISAIIMAFVSVVFKFHLRSIIFIIMLGIHCCVDNITGLITIMAATTMLDELIVTPLCKHYKNKLSINREIDKRL